MKKKLATLGLSAFILSNSIIPAFASEAPVPVLYSNYVPQEVHNEAGDVIGHTRSTIPQPVLYAEKELRVVPVLINADENTIKVLLNNKILEMDVDPVIENGNTLVPVRSISEALGAKVTWDKSTKTVNLTKENSNISLKLWNKNAKVNDKEVTLDMPAKIFNDRTFVPLRFISETFGCEVNWDKASKTITLKSNSDNLLQDSYQMLTEAENFKFIFTNTSENNLELNFNSGQKFEFILSKDGKEAWKYSNEMMFTQALETITLKPGETIEFLLNKDELPKEFTGEHTFEFYIVANELNNLDHFVGKVSL